MPEPVRLSVSEVRREIYSASGFAAGDGQPSTGLLGTIFHQMFRAIMDSRSEELGWPAVLDPENLNDHERLREHAYNNILGPKLRENQAALQTSASEVLTLWEATGHLCRYICQLLINSHEQNILRYRPGSNNWAGADQFSVEEELTWLIEDISWSAPVLLTGVVDGVWRNPASKRWCAMEMKLGAGSTGADLAQLCLYHEMLRSKSSGSPGAVSLLHFQPELKHDAFSEEQIATVKPQLLALIGRLAGVTGDGYFAASEPHAPRIGRAPG